MLFKDGLSLRQKKCPIQSLRVCKELLRRWDARALAEANEVESEALFRLMADPETMEAAMKLMSRRNKSKL